MSTNQKNKPWTFPINRDAILSDLTIVCCDKKYPAHRLVVFSASPVIMAAMKDEKFSEGVQNIFRVNDFEPEVVDKMIDYMYMRDYNFANTILANMMETKQILKHVKMNAIADCYSVLGLREMANEKIDGLLAEIAHDPKFPADLVEFLKLSFELSGDKELHAIAATTAAAHAEKLVQREDFQNLQMPGSFYTQVMSALIERVECRLSESLRLQKVLRTSKLLVSRGLLKPSTVYVCKTCHVYNCAKPIADPCNDEEITINCRYCKKVLVRGDQFEEKRA